MTDTSSLFSVKDLSKLLGISVSSVRVRVSKGKIPEPDHRIEGELYWDKATIEKAGR